MNNRYEQLDSIRGLAALTVLFGHVMYVIPAIAEGMGDNLLVTLLKYSPIHALWSGHEAVIVFFILSGFVLSLPFYSGKQSRYLPYMAKRFSRIYIPYIIAVSVAILLSFFFYSGNVAEASSWFNGMWGKDLTISSALNHLFLLGDFDPTPFNTVIWSLVHEMRISILFPLIMLIILKLNWKVGLGIGFLLSCCFAILGFLLKPEYGTNIYITLHYIFMFIIGALLAKHRDYLINKFQEMGRKHKFLLLIIAVGAYTYPWYFYNINILHLTVVNDWVVSIGASLFIVIGLSSRTVASFLVKKPLIFLGKVSYSLYLYHIIIVFSLVHILNGIVPLYIVLLISLPISLMFAYLAWLLVERPSMNLGRSWASFIVKRQPVQSVSQQGVPHNS